MVYTMWRALLVVTALIFLVTSAAIAQRQLRAERVPFEQGAVTAVVEGWITGHEIVDHVLGADTGQYMNVRMATDNTGNYFNLLAPGEDEVAMLNGSMGGNQFEGILPESGDYKVRVYMMRSAARRNETANDRLEFIIREAADRSSTPEGGPSDRDAVVEGTKYHATGDIPYAMSAGQPTTSCSFGVTRKGNGTGIVTVTKPDGRTRAIFFENGKATGYDSSEANPGEFSAEKQGDLSVIRIAEERYEIPDAVIFGG